MTASAYAQAPSHPLSQVTPIDSNLDMNTRNITNVGNIGIGTTTANYSLHVNGTLPELVLERNNAGFNIATFLIRPFGVTPDARAVLQVGSNRDDLANVLVLHEDGRVGINTTSPSGTLHVATGTGANALVINSTFGWVGIGTANPLEELAVRNYNNNVGLDLGETGGEAFIAARSGQSDNDNLIIQAQNFTFREPSGNARLFIDGSNGVIGIGTSNPAASTALTLVGTRELKIGTSGYVINDESSNLYFRSNSDTARVVFEDGGFVGINETDPSYTLQVTGGDVYLTSRYSKYRLNSDGGGNIGWIGTSSSGSGLEIETGSSSFGINITQGGNLKAVLDSTGSLSLNSDGTAYLGFRYDSGGSNAFKITTTQSGLCTQLPCNQLRITGRDSSGVERVIAVFSPEFMRLGINSTNPQKTLEVVGDINTTGLLYLRNNVGGILIQNTTGGYDNTQIFTDTSNRLKIIHAGVNPAIAIDSSANVGVGTASPDSNSKLQVVGRILSYDDTNNVNGIGLQYPGGNRFWISANSSSSLKFTVGTAPSGAVNDILIIGGSNGLDNVGISQENPSYKLAVNQSTAGGNAFRVTSGTNSAHTLVDVTGSVVLTSYPSTGTSVRITGYNSGGSSRVGVNLTNPASGEPNLILLPSGGNVGVGTNSPTNQLHILSSGATVSTDSAELLRIQNSASSTNAARISIIGGTAGESTVRFGDPDARAVGAIVYDHSTNNITFHTNSAPAAVITSSGRLGLGSSPNPNRMLDLIDGSIQLRQQNGIFWWNSNIDNSQMGFINFSAPGGIGGNLIFGTNGVEILRIDSDGEVGISTTNPQRNLHINSVLRLEPRASAPSSPSSGDMYVDSTPTPDELCFYDGSSWQGISSGTDGNCV